VALVVDGGALVPLLSPAHEDAFLELASAADAVICCRVSPMQKAQVRAGVGTCQRGRACACACVGVCVCECVPLVRLTPHPLWRQQGGQLCRMLIRSSLRVCVCAQVASLLKSKAGAVTLAIGE
jgi:hypothetical protein